MSSPEILAPAESVGILGGSFNPVHIGHMMIASYLVQWGYVDRVWLTLSPRTPLKNAGDLIPDVRRLSMLQIATRNQPGIETCDIELSMPLPSYTINTLEALRKRYPRKRFRLVIGADNWAIFHKWRDAQRILDEFGVIVYPRPGYPVTDLTVDGMEYVEAPTANISSTFVRQAIAAGKDMNLFLPQGVYKYIADSKLYLPKTT